MKRRVDRPTWDIVTELACEITNAALKDDHKRRQHAYRRLRAFIDEKARRHESHPWLLETLADFTENDKQAIRIYQRALRLATINALPRQTILLELGRRTLEIAGKRRAASRYLTAALAEARRRRDRDSAAEAAGLLKESENATH